LRSRFGSHDRDELAPGLRSYHLIYSRQQANPPMERSKARALSCSIAWQTTTWSRSSDSFMTQWKCNCTCPAT